jgi:glyoxylate/hydroxypyruvate reductase A
MFAPAPIPFVSAANYAKTQAWVHALQHAMPDEVIVPFAAMSTNDRAHCKLAIVANPDPSDLKGMPQLEWIHSVWAGVERLVAGLAHRDLKIVRLVDPQLANTMAESVLTYVLYLHRNGPLYARQQAEQHWQAHEYVRAGRRTVTLLGLGVLGQAAAKRLVAAGFRVCGWSRNKRKLDQVECFAGEHDLPHVLAQTDILVCLLPLTEETRGLLDAERLVCLPQGASLINFARGPIVDEAALLAALDTGHLSHAVLDVFEHEPLPAGHRFWSHPSVTVLPHCTAPTDMETASLIVARNVATWRNSGAIPAAVNLDRGY